MNRITGKRILGPVALSFFAGAVLGAGALATWLSRGADDGARDGFDFTNAALSSILREAHADLEDGDYDFFPNRRSIWVVNRTNGRMATYHFRDDELGSVDRSRVATIDPLSFPAKDTVIRLSDRNLNNILWVCNKRTGDVQMWYPGRDGMLRAEKPIVTSSDLMERTLGTKPGGK